MRSNPIDPTDPPAPLRAGLSRAGLLDEAAPLDVSSDPPPVRSAVSGGAQGPEEPGFAWVDIAGEPVLVRTTPPPPARRQGHRARSVAARRFDPLASMQPASEPPPPSPAPVRHDLTRGPALVAVVACVLLLGGFALFLFLG